jgi:hypothetical protein
MKTFRWSSDTVYMGGGKKRDKPSEHGTVTVAEDALRIEPDDDYYSGTLSREQALELAHAIIEAYGKPPEGTP